HQACHRCFAPLPSGVGSIRCAYCGAENVAAPQAWPPPSAAPPRTRGMSKLALVLALSLPLEAALCGGYVLWNAWRASDRAAPTAPAAPASLPVTPTAPAARPAHFRSRVCFLGDVTGDGVGELSGF